MTAQEMFYKLGYIKTIFVGDDSQFMYDSHFNNINEGMKFIKFNIKNKTVEICRIYGIEGERLPCSCTFEELKAINKQMEEIEQDASNN